MDKKPITEEKELEGKVIAQCHLNSFAGRLLFRFTDGSFTAFVAEVDTDNEPEIDFDHYVEAIDLRDVGILTREEYKEIWQAQEDEKREERRLRYQELKKEFGHEV